jgi:hypothetical protein
MLNEGHLVTTTAALVKSVMIRQIQELGPTTPDELERAVFRAMTGQDREAVDWDLEDNQAGYHTWIRSFDTLIGELVDDGYILADEHQGLRPVEAEPWSHVPALT